MKQISFGGGTVILDLPDEWDVSDIEFMGATIVFPQYPAIRLQITVNCYEHPESVACDDISCFVFEEGMPFSEDSGVAPETLFAYGFLPADSQTYVQIFKWGHILPPTHIRVLVARLETPFIENIENLPDTLPMQVLELIETSRFSNVITPLDRIALAQGLQLIQVENHIFIRVPSWWKSGRTEGGRYYCDTMDVVDGTLWIDWDSFRDLSGVTRISAREKAQQFTEIVDEMGHLDIIVEGDEEKAFLWSDGPDADGLAIFYGRVFVVDKAQFTMVTFSLVVTDVEANTPLVLACRKAVQREVRNAVVLLDRL